MRDDRFPSRDRGLCTETIISDPEMMRSGPEAMISNAEMVHFGRDLIVSQRDFMISRAETMPSGLETVVADAPPGVSCPQAGRSPKQLPLGEAAGVDSSGHFIRRA